MGKKKKKSTQDRHYFEILQKLEEGQTLHVKPFGEALTASRSIVLRFSACAPVRSWGRQGPQVKGAGIMIEERESERFYLIA